MLTHAKAFHRHPRIRLTVMDADAERTRVVAGVYAAPSINELTPAALKEFAIVSLCVPTALHFQFLKTLLEASVPLIICEKPVVATLEQITALRALYCADRHRILVNYIRRFQPGCLVLKNRLREILSHEALRHITIRYQRGFLNNCGHALDLLEFLFDRPTLMGRFHVLGKDFDAFPDDPTLSGAFLLGPTPVFVAGVPHAAYPIFELDLVTDRSRIEIRESGDQIHYHRLSDKSPGRFEEHHAWRQSGVIADYMVPVIEEALRVLDHGTPTNFASALDLNESMLKVLGSA